MHDHRPPWGRIWRRLALILRRLQLFAGLVGRRWSGGTRIGCDTAWQVACIVHDHPGRRVQVDLSGGTPLDEEEE